MFFGGRCELRSVGRRLRYSCTLENPLVVNSYGSVVEPPDCGGLRSLGGHRIKPQGRSRNSRIFCNGAAATSVKNAMAGSLVIKFT